MTLHQGSCQCGAVRYQVEVSLDQPVICNCSRCRRLGAVLVFAPKSGFTLQAGAEATTDYQFNKHVIHHLFCKTCGIESYAEGAMPDGSAVVAVNVNCLDGVDARDLAARAKFYDGAAA